MYHLFDKSHHIFIAGKSLVALHHGKFRVVTAINTLIAEIASNFIDPLEPTYDQSLEIELLGDTQIQVTIQSIMMGYERTSGSTTIQRLQDGRLDLNKAVVVQVTPHSSNRATADHEDLPDFITIGNQIEVALALARLLILQSMILFW